MNNKISTKEEEFDRYKVKAEELDRVMRFLAKKHHDIYMFIIRKEIELMEKRTSELERKIK